MTAAQLGEVIGLDYGKPSGVDNRHVDRELPISVVGRVVLLLDAFGSDGGPASLARLADSTGLPRATTYRLLSQLVEAGVVERSGAHYRLGLKMFELGSSVARQRRLREAAMPYLEALHTQVGETVHLGVLRGIEVLYIAKVAGHQAAVLDTRMGVRKPAHATALGKSILAYSSQEVLQAVLDAGLQRYTWRTITGQKQLLRELASVKQKMVALDREEITAGVSCVSAPVLDRLGRAKVAVSISAPTSRLNETVVVPLVQNTAKQIANALGGVPWLE